VVYDPKVPAEQIKADVLGRGVENARLVIASSAAVAAEGAHVVAVVTEWDEFKALDYAALYERMVKPAFVFDGRNILDLAALRAIGFKAFGIGK